MDYRTLTPGAIQDEGEAIARDAQTLFGHLSPQQLDWKADPDSWSVAQCLEHLIVINRAYFPVFDQVLKGEHTSRVMHRLPFLSTLWGRLMIRVLSPDSRPKLNAPRRARPSSSRIGPDIVTRFVTHQRELLAKMSALESGQRETIITSPFARLVTYSAIDACRFIVAHERRHFAQAERVMAADGFPRTPRRIHET